MYLIYTKTRCLRLKLLPMTGPHQHKFTSSIFLTFSGNCKEALTFYQVCFGGRLQLETFDKQLQDYPEGPVVSGSVVADSIIIHGSDLVPEEGRILGNYMAILIKCANMGVRRELIEKLNADKIGSLARDNNTLIEVVDRFDIRWMLYV